MSGTWIPTQVERDETRKQRIETDVHLLGVPIRRRHRSGSDRLRRRIRPLNPDRRARRAAPAGSPRARADPNADADRNFYCDTSPLYEHAYTYASAAYKHTDGYAHADTADKHADGYAHADTADKHADGYASAAYKHTDTSSYSCADGYAHADRHFYCHTSTAYEYADTYTYRERSRSQAPNRDPPMVQ